MAVRKRVRPDRQMGPRPLRRRWGAALVDIDTRAEAEGLERSTRWHYANDLHRHLLSKESGLGPLRPVQVWISRRRSHACIPS